MKKKIILNFAQILLKFYSENIYQGKNDTTEKAATKENLKIPRVFIQQMTIERFQKNDLKIKDRIKAL